LERVEWLPFKRLIRADIPMLMTAHILLPVLDAMSPATLSYRLLTEKLRGEMGFEGVIVSDDLEMKAIADRYGIVEAVTMGLRAGVDLFLICRQPELWSEAYATLVSLAEGSSADRERVLASASRVVTMKTQWLTDHRWTPVEGWRDVVGCQDHREVVAAIEAAAQDAATMV